MRAVVVMGILGVLVAACAGDAGGTQVLDTVTPEATADEVFFFCERYKEVKDLDIGTMWEELLEVAPEELEQPLIRLTTGPNDGYWDDRASVENFIDQCE